MTKQTKRSLASPAQNGLSFLRRHEKQLLIIVMLFAALRIFLFNAAFPFFNNVDELHHYDAVVKYARGYIPQKQNNLYDYESARTITLYATPEYFYAPSAYRNNRFPPPVWRVMQFVPIKEFDQVVSSRTLNQNTEAFSPPLYYAVIGVWYNVGKWLGMTGGFGLYWIRFSNIIVFLLLLLATNKFCKLLVPENLSLRYSVLLLLACFPQDVFYSIVNDAFSPLFFLFALLFLWKIYLSQKNALFYLFTGIFIAAAVLVKITNIILFGTMVFILGKKLLEYRQNKKFKKGLFHVGLCLVGAFVPIAIWMTANSILIGDPLGTTEKVQSLGWTLKPFHQWFHHPLFSVSGMFFFISELLKTFWRGEFVWELKILASTSADTLYVFSTILFIAASILSVLIRKKSSCSSDRYDYMILLLSIAGSVFMLGVLSLMYDFGACWYPSKEHPYFTSGRLILGTLVPFIIFYVDGLQTVLSVLTKQLSAVWVILALVVFITISEISLSLPVFLSQYNFFHLF
jgi:hypothetical protein